MLTVTLVALTALAGGQNGFDAPALGLWYLADGSRTPKKVAGAKGDALGFHGDTVLVCDSVDGNLYRCNLHDGRTQRLFGPSGRRYSLDGEVQVSERVNHGYLLAMDNGLAYVPDASRRVLPVRLNAHGVQLTLRGIVPTHGGAVIATENTGLWAWNEGSSSARRVPTFRPFAYGQANATYLECVLSTPGKTWIGTAGEGLWCLREGARKAVRVAGFPANGDSPRLLAVGGSVTVCSGSGLWKIDPARVSAQPWPGILGQEQAYDVFERDGKLLISAADGVWIRAKAGGVSKRIGGFPPGDRLLFKADGELVLERATGELYTLDLSTDTVRKIDEIKDEIIDAYARRDDILVGTDENGLWDYDRHTRTVGRIGRSSGQGASGFRRYGHGVLFSVFRDPLPH